MNETTFLIKAFKPGITVTEQNPYGTLPGTLLDLLSNTVAEQMDGIE
jgi:hypothetical protein